MSSYVLFVVYITNEDVINETKCEQVQTENTEPVNEVFNNIDFADCEIDAVPETPEAGDQETEEPVFIQNNVTVRFAETAYGNPEVTAARVGDVSGGDDAGGGESNGGRRGSNDRGGERSNGGGGGNGEGEGGTDRGAGGDHGTDTGDSGDGGRLPDAGIANGGTGLKRFLSVHSLKQDVVEKLKQLSVKNAVWQKTHDNSLHQVTFIQESGNRCEQILDALTEVGVGRIAGSSVCVFPSSINIVKDLESEKGSEEDTGPEVDLEALAEENKSEFKKSIKSRLVVNQVIESVESNAQFTFDYLMLIILASIIAGMGLAENSSVVLVASMLISPLMGPILAGVFGTMVSNDELRNLGFKSEIIGLGICVVIGFLFGLVTGGVGLKGAAWGSTNMWPTSEMATRGQLRSLWSGALIALPSGAGVALSVLGGNAGSLVGVAISASLLPPAVNAGMLWAYAILAGIVPPQVTATNHLSSALNSTRINNTVIDSTVTVLPPNCLKFENNDYVPVHSCDMATEAAILGAISLLLTILNIVCIILMGIFMLKIKAVVPSPATLQEEFFHTDMMIYKQSHVTMKGKKSVEIGKMFCEEYKKLAKKQKDDKEDESYNKQEQKEEIDKSEEDDDDDVISSVKLLFCREALEELEQSYEVKEILRRVPYGKKPVPISFRLTPVFDEAETNFHRLISLKTENSNSSYHTIHAFNSSVLNPAKQKFIPLTPQPMTARSQKFIFPTRPLLRRRTYQSIPKETNVTLSTINEEGAKSAVPTQRKFIVKTFKEEGNDPKTTNQKQSGTGDQIEELPLLP
ncbi:uncharacterized protein LOC121376516 [Gigantopelta aegis]|uniref:uncharacterized protein LOC121376516 n=1 Tax=Gigantopelta aegis TaxID=1735272 RepID=UPI001B88870E|nr:uncharacterized protein LOC121376516 [Gigantopelta aegis]